MSADLLHFNPGPQRIVCLTEETTEWLYLLGQERRIVGISGYTVRPKRARDEKPRVSAFLSAKLDKIMELQPDCVLGFSDLQADIASDLVKRGVQVTIFNQRSVAEIFSMLFQLAAMVGEAEQGAQRIAQMQADLRAMQMAVAARVATGHAQQLGHPADRADVRAVPFFKKHLGAARAGGHPGRRGRLHGAQAVLHLRDAPRALLRFAHHGRELEQHGKNFGHAALVEDGDLHAALDQVGRDIGLQV